MEIYVWLALTIFFLAVELATVGLVSIWFAAGSLAALIVSFFGGNIYIQTGVFIVVSLIMLLLTRPFAQKHINRKMQKTNVDSIIGEKIVLTEDVDNFRQTGKAFVQGQEWSVRASDDDRHYKSGSMVQIVAVRGVMLIVEEIKEG